MSTLLLAAVITIFVSVAVTVAAGANLLLSWVAPERRRLRDLKKGPAAGLVVGAPRVMESLGPLAARAAAILSKSPRDLSRLRQRLTTAGYRNLSAAIWYSASKLLLSILCGLGAFLAFGLLRGLAPAVARLWIVVGVAAVAGFFLPDMWLGRATRLRQKAIRNGLPDALDLMIVCLEAGSSLDQAILKASDELQLVHPALADEFRLMTTEIRAGKSRIDALKNLADRTRVADVRSLASMLVQTDRFGTSVAQALRTHAQTSRTKRRQRAEERAAKVGVKLVFPLVFFLFPAFYVVILGPAVIRFIHIFVEWAMPSVAR